jgi:hypothetical protein
MDFVLALLLSTSPVSSFQICQRCNNPLRLSPFKASRFRSIVHNCKNKNDEPFTQLPLSLRPLATQLSSFTTGRAFTYADLSPETPTSPVGFAFLCTNFGFNIGGLSLVAHGDYCLGSVIEIAGLFSILYHYQQLSYPEPSKEVQVALLCDYCIASVAIVTGLVYALQVGVLQLPVEALASSTLAVLCLLLGWVWEFGYPYIFFHSLWHIFGAFAAFSVGQAHIQWSLE